MSNVNQVKIKVQTIQVRKTGQDFLANCLADNSNTYAQQHFDNHFKDLWKSEGSFMLMQEQMEEYLRFGLEEYPEYQEEENCFYKSSSYENGASNIVTHGLFEYNFDRPKQSTSWIYNLATPKKLFKNKTDFFDKFNQQISNGVQNINNIAENVIGEVINLNNQMTDLEKILSDIKEKPFNYIGNKLELLFYLENNKNFSDIQNEMIECIDETINDKIKYAFNAQNKVNVSYHFCHEFYHNHKCETIVLFECFYEDKCFHKNYIKI